MPFNQALYNLEIIAVNEDNIKTDQAQFIQFNIDKALYSKMVVLFFNYYRGSLWVILFFSEIIKKKILRNNSSILQSHRLKRK